MVFRFHERNSLDKIERRMLHIITIFVLNGKTLPISNRPKRERAPSLSFVQRFSPSHFQLYFTHVANCILNFKHLAQRFPQFHFAIFLGEMKFSSRTIINAEHRKRCWNANREAALRICTWFKILPTQNSLTSHPKWHYKRRFHKYYIHLETNQMQKI